MVCDDGPSWVRFHGKVWDLVPDEGVDPVEPRRRQRGRRGFGIYSVLRALLAHEGGATQSELAKHAHVTQSRVPQTLETLRAIDLVVKRERSWVVMDNKGAIDWWVAHYPGPAGLRTHWYGLDGVMQQAYRTYEFLNGQGARPVVSGDVAADLVAPWRTPRHALLYAERGADLTRIGLTPAGPKEATLTVVLPEDPAVRPIGDPPHLIELPGMGDIARAGALQVLWDLKRGTGPDADEAAEAWLRWMLDQTAVV